MQKKELTRTSPMRLRRGRFAASSKTDMSVRSWQPARIRLAHVLSISREATYRPDRYTAAAYTPSQESLLLDP